MATLWLQNLLFYTLQIAVIAAAGAVLLHLLQIWMPTVRLICLQTLVAACLLLPAMQPWLPLKTADSAVKIFTTPATPIEPGGHSNTTSFPAAKFVLLLLVAGAVIRFGMLGLGLWRIRRYRRNSRAASGAVEPLPRRMGVYAEVRVSTDVSGPVTFGFLRPVILLPEGCLGDEPIVYHELIHVRRRDWLFAVIEECILCVFWFHPAMWWLVAEIQLAREEVVDREVVAILNSRDRYLETLLTLAAASAGLELAPASLFLRKRHLKKRVASLLKEVSMSKLRLSFSLAAYVAALALISWLGVRSFPLQAAPQERADTKGVTVQPGALTLLHRTPVQYPQEALAKRIEGTVVLDITLSETGTVSDARVLSGPEELRSAALQSVLQWHYANDARVPAKAQVTVDFRLPESSPAAVSRITPAPLGDDAATLEHLVLLVPEAIKQKIEGRLTVREGDRLTQAAVSDLSAAVQAVDEHLRVAILTGKDKKASTVIIRLDGSSPVQPPPGKIQVGSEIQDVNLVKKVTPEYPPLAKQARIQGVVRFSVIIGKDGSVQSVQLISGHPLLVQPAKDALVQWVYKPTLLNGQPVEVTTQVELAFTLVQ